MVGHCFICSQKIMTTSFSFKTHLFSPRLFRAETPMPYEKWLKNEFSQCVDSKDRQISDENTRKPSERGILF